MQIWTIRKGFKAFEFKLEPFERDSKSSNANLKHLNPNLNDLKGFEAFKSKFKPFERDLKHSNLNSNHSKRIRSIRMENQKEIRTIWKQFRTIRMKTWTIRKGFEGFDCKFVPFEQHSKNSNGNWNPLNEIRIIQMQILTIRKGFEGFEWKF